MRQRGAGRLVFVSSVAGRLALPLGGAYAQSKWALEAIAETLALELAQTDVRVSVIEPAAIAGIGRSKARATATTKKRTRRSGRDSAR